MHLPEQEFWDIMKTKIPEREECVLLEQFRDDFIAFLRYVKGTRSRYTFSNEGVFYYLLLPVVYNDICLYYCTSVFFDHISLFFNIYKFEKIY